MRAAFLVRCSTNKQDFERQITDLHKVAESFNFSVEESNIFGEEITGKDDTTKKDRVSIKRLRAAAEAGKFDVILIAEVSRLSRDSVSGRVYVRQFNNLGIPVYFRDRRKWTIDLETRLVSESFEKELGHYFDGAAEYLKSMKTQTASGRRNRLLDNQMIQGKPAFGYKKQGGLDKYTRNTVVINPETAPIVKATYHKYLEEGATLKSTTLAISAMYGSRFSIGKINHILNYTGYHTGQTTVEVVDPDDKTAPKEIYPITFEPLIDEELFKKVQQKLKTNRASKVPHNAKQKVHLLSRLIKCSFCERSFTPRKRSDKRTAYNWLCMSRINNAAKCDSYINLNDEIMTFTFWEFLKREVLSFTAINDDEKMTRIAKETNKIESSRDEIAIFTSKISEYERIQKRAYDIYLKAPEEAEDVAGERYNETLLETQKEINYLNGKISLLKQVITDSNNKIERYNNTDFSESYIKDVENDPAKKRALFLEYVKAIYPYKVGYRIVVFEFHTIEGIFYILFDGNPRNTKKAYYINYIYARWQNSNNKLEAYDEGDYFVISNADMVTDTEEIDLTVTFDEMQEICAKNDWVIQIK